MPQSVSAATDLDLISYLKAIPVTARKDDAPAAIQAANVNVAGVGSISADGGLIQTTSG